MMSIASVCKGKKKKKNQSPLSTTLNPCRSASCLLFVSVPTLKKKVKKKEEEKKKERERKKKKKKRKRKKEKERGKEKEKKKPCTAQLRLSPSQSDMVFRLSCPFIHFPSFQPVGGTRRAPPGSSVRTPEGCSISSKKKKKKKGCFNPCCKQSSDSLCWLSRIAKRFLQQGCCGWS